MTTIALQTVVCPLCQNKMSAYELTSYHTYSATSYSDGYTENNPPIPFNQKVNWCAYCDKPFWRADAQVIDPYLEDHNSNTKSEDWPSVKDAHDLPFRLESDLNNRLAIYYNELLESGFADTIHKEVGLRIEIWHIINHNYRYRQYGFTKLLVKGRFREFLYRLKRSLPEVTLTTKIKHLFNNNLEKLAAILHPQTADEYLMLAEIYRELGEYKKAKQQLREFEITENKVTSSIRKAIRWRRKRVFELT